MDLRFSQFEVLTTTGSLFIALLFVCIFLEASDIEQELGVAALQAVAEQEVFWSSVAPSGQQLVLFGAVPDPASRRAAALRASAVPGVLSVENRVVVVGESGHCQFSVDAVLNDHPLAFKKGKAELTDAGFEALPELAKAIRACDARLEVASHTDAEGDAEINLRLSQRRADVVRKYLVQHGVAGARLESAGYGETQPVADGSTAAGQRANQRTELRVVGGAA